MTTNAAQHTPEWFKARLGNITGSMVGILMENGKKKNDIFSVNGKKELFRIAAERTMNPYILQDEMLFEDYLNQVSTTSKSMQFGTEQEPSARKWYNRITGRKVVEVSSIPHPSIPHFASSPDGFFYDEEKEEKGVIEIKCPSQSTFMIYKAYIHDNDSLLKTEPKYYYQCMAHMMVTGASWCDFVVYCPFQRNPIHIVRIHEDKESFSRMEIRIRLANDFIEKIIS